MLLPKNPPELMHDLLKKDDKYLDAEEVKKVTKITVKEENPSLTNESYMTSEGLLIKTR